MLLLYSPLVFLYVQSGKIHFGTSFEHLTKQVSTADRTTGISDGCRWYIPYNSAVGNFSSVNYKYRVRQPLWIGTNCND